MKKSPFLLIEVLIALVLIELCAVPLVKQPLKFYMDEVEYLQKMELQRLADWTFTEVEEILLKNEIPWEKIPKQSKESGPFPLPNAEIQIPGCKKKEVKRQFRLTGHGEKLGLNGQEYRLVWIQVMLDKEVFWFRIPIQKIVVE